jgi:hypothetical protein
MKKSILHIGKALDTKTQKQVHGGGKTYCNSDVDCCFTGNPIYQYVCNGIVCIIGTPPVGTCDLG